jgi:signal transduction histidine kinase
MNEMSQSALNDKEIIQEDPSDVIQCIANDDYDWLTKQLAALFGFSDTFMMLWNGQQSSLKSYFGKQEQASDELLDSLSALVYNAKDFYLIENIASHPQTEKINCRPGLNFFIGVPFKTKAGVIIGAIGLMNDGMPESYTEHQLGLLRILVMLLTDNIELRYSHKFTSEKQKLINRKFTHDLRNPLTVISLNAEIIKMEANLPSGVRDMCDQVKEATGSMNQLIDNFAAIQKNAQ